MDGKVVGNSAGELVVGGPKNAAMHLSALKHLDPPTRVPIQDLVPADSPRLEGEDEAHTRVLAESESELPPILVHRPTMRVIDGMHRLRAAAMRGDETITVQYFDGPADAVFVLAVASNVAHGLPLSLRDRERAAARILAEHPEWSDRAIATASGLSAKTVGAIRRRTQADLPELTGRIGRDGRVRPLNSADGRRSAAEFIAANPTASLRQIARDAGISLSTARDVRERVQRGDDPLVPRQRAAEAAPAPPARTRDGQRTGPQGTAGRERTRAILEELKRDPSLRFSESGRTLLRWLHTRVNDIDGWNQLVNAVPVHCSYLLIEVARSFADGWQAAADRLRTRLDTIE